MHPKNINDQTGCFVPAQPLLIRNINLFDAIFRKVKQNKANEDNAVLKELRYLQFVM